MPSSLTYVAQLRPISRTQIERRSLLAEALLESSNLLAKKAPSVMCFNFFANSSEMLPIHGSLIKIHFTLAIS